MAEGDFTVKGLVWKNAFEGLSSPNTGVPEFFEKAFPLLDQSLAQLICFLGMWSFFLSIKSEISRLKPLFSICWVFYSKQQIHRLAVSLTINQDFSLSSLKGKTPPKTILCKNQCFTELTSCCVSLNIQTGRIKFFPFLLFQTISNSFGNISSETHKTKPKKNSKLEENENNRMLMVKEYKCPCQAQCQHIPVYTSALRIEWGLKLCLASRSTQKVLTGH